MKPKPHSYPDDRPDYPGYMLVGPAEILTSPAEALGSVHHPARGHPALDERHVTQANARAAGSGHTGVSPGSSEALRQHVMEPLEAAALELGVTRASLEAARDRRLAREADWARDWARAWAQRMRD